MKAITNESPLIAKQLIASNPIRKITVIAKAYYDNSSNIPEYRTYVIPSASTEDLISASYDKSTQLDTISEIAKHDRNALANSQNCIWTGYKSVNDWSDWNSLKRAIIEEHNYLLTSHSNHNGFFRILVHNKHIANGYLDNHWYEVISQNDRGRVNVLPHSKWLDWNRQHKNRVNSLIKTILRAPSSSRASVIVSTNRNILPSHIKHIDYHTDRLNHIDYVDTTRPNRIIGIGRDVFNDIIFTGKILARKELAQANDNNNDSKASRALHAASLILRKPDLFYKYDFRTGQLQLASVKEITELISFQEIPKKTRRLMQID